MAAGKEIGMRIGYVRVSTKEQNEQRQVEALEGSGIEKWFIEKASGKDTERRELKAMLGYVREGDTVYISDFSRMSRSVSDLLGIIEGLVRKNVGLVSLKEQIDTTTPSGKLMLHLIAAINEFERTNMLERQREGIEIARRNGKYKGRRPMVLERFDEVYGEWKEGRITACDASRLLGVSRSTFYNKVAQREAKADTGDGDTGNAV